MANELSGKPLYTPVMLCSHESGVRSSSGIKIDALALASGPADPDTLIICGGVHSHAFDDSKTIARIRQMSRNGRRVGAISGGVFLLAKMGLLHNQRFALHWIFRKAFADLYPNLTPSAENHVVDGNLLTCAGGIASFEFMLNIIAKDHGAFLSGQVADQFIFTPQTATAPPSVLYSRAGLNNRSVVAAVRLMEDRTEFPISMAELAESAGTSRRQLERLFKRFFGKGPSQFYRSLRLKRAHELLLHSNLSVTEVSFASGFQSPAYFSKLYRDEYNQPPVQTRQALARQFS
ncbi:GlxA family transcriptional regulator [Mesorhizobium sp.]|uniref:GlxA family transcriptional regulator n=1 Tax=Mesorhizobium sp. TaxID=1871066 RepID=UPI0025C09D5B|nr:GlxA family transcriptional regulator [Mesorhizobium sp.]